MVRYADGPRVEVETVVDATAAKVWALVTDLDVPARFSAEYRGGEWLDRTGPGVGTRFRGHNHHPLRGEWSTVSTIVEWIPQRRFAWAVDDVERPAASWTFERRSASGGSDQGDR